VTGDDRVATATATARGREAMAARAGGRRFARRRHAARGPPRGWWSHRLRPR